ncbi:hypothetical protein FRC98_06030 [Lujinxingia vulgaris]|uniref:Uncharacterized protein n=1 Tax=Lujinxingia vulgaris TaxID=2600176 RepID=A0A5C6XDB3_9DELT|nr:hypothetical protein [Lujinxingia vulgaris]TXD38438.1 hypothetical protein FRC98_06030 [Lujinxingia vulgaris]
MNNAATSPHEILKPARWAGALALTLSFALPVLLELAGLARVGHAAPAEFIALATDQARSAPLFWPLVALAVVLSRPDSPAAPLALGAAATRALVATAIFVAAGLPFGLSEVHLWRALSLAPTALFLLLALRLFAHRRDRALLASAASGAAAGALALALPPEVGWAPVMSAALTLAPLVGAGVALRLSRAAEVWRVRAAAPSFTLARAPGLILIWAGALSLLLGARLLARQDLTWRSEWLSDMPAHAEPSATALRELAGRSDLPGPGFALWSDWPYAMGAYTPGGFVALAYLLCTVLALVALVGLGVGAAKKLSRASSTSPFPAERVATATAATLVIPLLVAPASTLQLLGADPLLAFLGIQPARMIAAGLIFVALLFTLLPEALSRTTLASRRYALLGALVLVAPPATLLFLTDHARVTPLGVASTISLGAGVLTTLLSLKIPRAADR